VWLYEVKQKGKDHRNCTHQLYVEFSNEVNKANELVEVEKHRYQLQVIEYHLMEENEELC
jgi:hypothetical protein